MKWEYYKYSILIQSMFTDSPGDALSGFVGPSAWYWTIASVPRLSLAGTLFQFPPGFLGISSWYLIWHGRCSANNRPFSDAWKRKSVIFVQIFGFWRFGLRTSQWAPDERERFFWLPLIVDGVIFTGVAWRRLQCRPPTPTQFWRSYSCAFEYLNWLNLFSKSRSQRTCEYVHVIK